ncbi:MAG: L,D-transpeptidase [Verrucomicrobia bacterium]|nr:L,D-transpeptidase [Verrucomicrobiota bacterium]
MSGPVKLPLPAGDGGVASPRLWLPGDFFHTVRRCGLQFTRDVLWVRVRRQLLLHGSPLRFNNRAHRDRRFPDYVPLAKRFRVSTSRFGIGQVADSNRTPLGLHRIAQKIGGGWPVGTVFKGRKPVGFTWKGLPLAPITTRILWLEGLEPGFNRGGNVDSFARYIYIHGTGDEPSLGRPASHGCIHLAADDLMPLFDELPVGTLVWISRE